MVTETWKPIADFAGYEVSDLGNVRCWKNKNGKGMGAAPHLLKQSKFAGKNYLRVSLYKDGVPHIKRVHCLVLEAFVGERPFGEEALHGDDDGTNNQLDNLRWGTKLENAADRIANGKQARGENVTRARLTDEQVREIKEKLSAGSYGIGSELAREYGVTPFMISCIKNGKTWRHV